MPAVQPLAVSVILEIFWVYTRTVKVKIVPARVVLMPERENRIIVILVDTVTGKLPDDRSTNFHLYPFPIDDMGNGSFCPVDIAPKRRLQFRARFPHLNSFFTVNDFLTPLRAYAD